MTVDERNQVLEAAEILQTLGGNNGFTNLRPELKKLLRTHGKKLKTIVENDIRGGSGSSAEYVVEEFEGETIYE